MLDFNNYRDLHPNGRDLIIRLYEESCRDTNNYFYSFSTLWMAFNGWMSCVSGETRDSNMLNALTEDRSLNAEYEKLYNNNVMFIDEVTAFSEAWPIYNVRDVKNEFGNNFIYNFKNRADLIQEIDQNISVRRRPADWIVGNRPEFGDLLASIYQVRCNLFHGEKSPENEMDNNFVKSSYILLRIFIESSNCLDAN